MIKIRLVNYFDVWAGDDEGTWQVNNLCAEWDRYIPDLEDATLLQLLIDEGFIKRDVQLDQIDFVFVGPEVTEIEESANGYPLGRFEILEYDTHAKISIDNGRTFITPEEAILREDWDTIVHYMDDDARESAHRDLAPCGPLEFLTEYLRRACCDLIIG